MVSSDYGVRHATEDPDKQPSGHAPNCKLARNCMTARGRTQPQGYTPRRGRFSCVTVGRGGCGRAQRERRPPRARTGGVQSGALRGHAFGL